MSNKSNFFKSNNLNEVVVQRCSYKQEGTVIGRIELDDGLYVELCRTESSKGVQDKVVIWLCHKKHNRKMYAFSLRPASQRPVCLTIDMEIIIKMNFFTSYADLKKAYVKKYCKS